MRRGPSPGCCHDFVPVNDVTALARNVSRSFDLVDKARTRLAEAEWGGDARAVQRAAKGLRDAEAKSLADERKAGAAARSRG